MLSYSWFEGIMLITLSSNAIEKSISCYSYSFLQFLFITDYIAAAEERAGRVSRNNEDKKNNDEKKFKDSPMTRSTEMKVKKQPTVNQMKRSQSTPRVNSILKMNNSITNSNGMGAHKNGISNKLEKKSEKKTVTIVQNG